MIAAAAERALTFSYRPVVSAAPPPGFAPWRSEIDLGGCRTEFQAGFVTSTTSAPLTALPNEAAARFVLALSANCHSAPASHRSCSARQTGTSRRSYGSRFSQPLFRLPFADVARVYAAFKSRAARVHGVRHAPAFPDDLGTLAQAASRLLRLLPGRRRRGRAHLGRAVRDL